MGPRATPRLRRTVLAAVGLVACSAAPVQAGFVVAPGAPFIGVGDNSTAIAAGDLNGDGRQDLVVANSSDPGAVAVFLGDGSGAFAKPLGSPFASGAAFNSDVALGDLDADGSLDAVSANNLSGTGGDDGRVSVLAGAGAGALAAGTTPASGGDRAASLEVADVTGDGQLDVAVANRSSGADAQPGKLTLLEGNGDGTVDAPVAVGDVPTPTALAARDLTGDGRVDLATANSGGTISVFVQQPAGTFTPAPGSPVAAGALVLVGLTAGDLNGDGDLDLAATSREPVMAGTPGRVAVMLGDGSGAFAPAAGSPVATGGQNARGVVAADFTGDARLDLAVTHAQIPGSVGVLAGDGAGGFAPIAGSPFATSFVEQATALAAADFNGDGRPDLATAHSENAARMVVLLNTGTSVKPCHGKRCCKGHKRCCRRHKGTKQGKCRPRCTHRKAKHHARKHCRPHRPRHHSRG